MTTKVAQDRQGIQSIEVGFSLLKVLAAHNRPMMLRDIAKGAGMPPAKAHRYMVSFMRIGLIEQDAASGRYDLGAYALELGLSGLGRLDPVRLATPILEELCETVHETVALAVWGTHGATIVRIFDAGGPVMVTLRAGTVTEIREHGISRATGSLTPGINGFSAPVYDHTGHMVAAITSLGPVGEFNVEWDSPVASAMLQASALLSQRLGYQAAK